MRLSFTLTLRFLTITSLLFFSTAVWAGGYETAAGGRLSPGQVAMLSLIPGEGQFYNQRPRKGWFFLGAEVLTVSGIALTAAAGQRAWYAYRLSDTAEEEDHFLFDFRQQQLNKRNFIYLYLVIKAASALDAYVDAHFFEIDHKAPEIGVFYFNRKINLAASFTW